MQLSWVQTEQTTTLELMVRKTLALFVEHVAEFVFDLGVDLVDGLFLSYLKESSAGFF